MQYRKPVDLIRFMRITAVMAIVMVNLAIADDTPATAVSETGQVHVLSSQMIWDAAGHNAFTDLIRWKDRWYCSFREGEAHGSYDGKVRILVSADGKAWQSLVQFAEMGCDLRDPKLCVLPDGRLLVGVGARQQDKEAGGVDATSRVHFASRVYITKDGQQWDGPHTVGDPGVWMWRFATRGEYTYSFGYRALAKGRGNETFLRFYRSRNGVDWEKITQTEAGGGYVNEAAFVFEPDDRCVVLLRREGGNNRLGLANPPYTDWKWTDLDERFNGPALLRLPDGRILASGRSKALGAPQSKTTVGWLTTDPPRLHPLQWLPSQHETGYPGLALHEGQIWASYYSSESGKCAIHIAQLELVDGKP